MNKYKAIAAAKEFCELRGVEKNDVNVGLGVYLPLELVLSDFLQSMIEKGQVVEASYYKEVCERLKETLIPFGEWVIIDGDEFNQGQVVDYDVLNNEYKIDKNGQWHTYKSSSVSKSTVPSAGKADDLALKAYCKHSEVEGFIFTTYQGRSSQGESNGYCHGFQNGYKQAILDNQFKSPTASTVKEISDEGIQRYIKAAHPDTVGNKPIQILMREKIRVSLEWYREQVKQKP